MPEGTGLQFSARELPSCAKAPSRCRPMTLSPGLNRVTPSPIATTSPAASLPGMKGGSGRNWYLPASISTSTYWTPRAAMRTCTSPGPGGGGSGTSRNASTSGPPNASHTIAFIAALLTPIVEHEEPGPAVARLVRAMHRDALDLRAEAAPEHRSVGLLARQIDAGHHIHHADCGGERGAGIEQRGKTVLRSGSRLYRAELDEALRLAGLALGPAMADRKAGEPAVAIPQQHRIAELAGGDGADLGPQIEAVIQGFGEIAGRGFRLRALTRGQI